MEEQSYQDLYEAYAVKAMDDCLEMLGKGKLAILYRYELKHLQTEILEAMENETNIDYE